MPRMTTDRARELIAECHASLENCHPIWRPAIAFRLASLRKILDRLEHPTQTCGVRTATAIAGGSP
jgi:hypothetical protein